MWIRSLRFAAAWWLLALVPVAGLAGEPRAYLRGIDPGKVCFPDGCVAVGWGRLGFDSGAKSACNAECIMEVRDARGKVIDEVKAGGVIVVVSPQIYAKRRSVKETFTLHRIDGEGKAVKTPFVEIISHLLNKDWFDWNFAGITALGLTEPRVDRGLGQTNTTGSRGPTGNLVRTSGKVGGITANGQLTALHENVAYVYHYGDYRIIAHADRRTFTIADGDYRALTPRLDNVALFRTWYDQRVPLAFETQQWVFALRTTKAGERQLYQVLPRQGAALPEPDVVGFAPLLGTNWHQCSPDSYYAPTCAVNLRGWIAIRATESAPLLSVVDAFAEKWYPERYRSLDWVATAFFETGIAGMQDGTFRLVGQKDIQSPMIPSGPAYASLAEAKAAVNRMYDNEFAAWNRQLQAEAEMQARRYAAWQEQQAAEQRMEAARIAAEKKENDEADALIARGDLNVICSALPRARTYYAQQQLGKACDKLRADLPPPAMSFWGALQAGIKGYSAAAAASGGGSVPPGGGATPGAYDQGQFDASMRSIDNAIRVISDPNWNGAAAASFR